MVFIGKRDYARQILYPHTSRISTGSTVQSGFRNCGTGFKLERWFERKIRKEDRSGSGKMDSSCLGAFAVL
jgi:hypothetical protein